MGFEPTVLTTWPDLAWLAHCRPHASTTTIFHGAGVEAQADWFCEAVWAGAYEKGGFDRTDIVAGTGGRCRGSEMVFVSSGNTVDRLQWFLAPDGTAWISNSLACLLAALDAQVDPAYPHYARDLWSIRRGLREYKRTIETTKGLVNFSYFENLRWNGRDLAPTDKPEAPLDARSFSKYRGYLMRSLELLADNMNSPWRGQPYEMLGTISTGYDSPTVAALARHAGCQEALTFDRSNCGDTDSGQAIADALGIRLRQITTDSWRTAQHPEIPFLAADGRIDEVHFHAATSCLANKVLMTGYHGDKIWNMKCSDLSSNIVRGDASGLGQSEFRLQQRYIHCPLPFFGARRIKEIVALSHSSELSPWVLPELDYNRPICRRIVEESGVPRNAFGIKKKALSVYIYDNFLTQSSREDYCEWLRDHRRCWLRRFRIPPIQNAFFDEQLHSILDYDSRTRRIARRLARFVPGAWQLAYRPNGPANLRRYVFPWAIERTIRRYASPLSSADVPAAFYR